jgi:hypothetical protein
MATPKKHIQRRVERHGTISATHSHIMAKLGLEGCNRVRLDAALAELEESGVITVSKTSTHTTISPC